MTAVILTPFQFVLAEGLFWKSKIKLHTIKTLVWMRDFSI